jgi:hypothetical protein
MNKKHYQTKEKTPDESVFCEPCRHYIALSGCAQGKKIADCKKKHYETKTR